MDEYFEEFLREFGPALHRCDVPTSAMERFRGGLPDQLLTYWREFGWSGYADGLFWTVSPEEYEPVLHAWIGDTPLMELDAFHVIARGAFGDILMFGERTGMDLHIIAADARVVAPSPSATKDLDLSVRSFFSSQNRGAYNRTDANGDRLFARALKKLGPLQPDEMYGFVPALALGGPATLDHLQKVKAVPHLVMLAQLAPLRVLNLG